MTSRTLRKDVSSIPVLVEPAVADAFVPKPAEAPSAESAPEPAPAPELTAAPGGQSLSEREQAVLAFEKRQWKHSGAKDQAIRDSFELSPTRYYQILNALLDRPEAQQFEPVLVNRLRRQRAGKQRARSSRVRPNPA
jgi:hypothetical protein